MKQKEHKIDLLSLIFQLFKIFFDNGLKGDKIMINSFSFLAVCLIIPAAGTLLNLSRVEKGLRSF